VLLLAGSCAPGGQPPPKRPAGVVSPGRTLFIDSLERDAGNGWPSGAVGYGSYTFDHGLVARIDQGNLAVTVRPAFKDVPDGDLLNVIASVGAERMASVGDGTYYGVYCRQDRTPRGQAGRTGLLYRLMVAVAANRAGALYPARYEITRDGDRDSDFKVLKEGSGQVRSQHSVVAGACVDDAHGHAHLVLFVDREKVLEADDPQPLAAGFAGLSIVNGDDHPALVFRDFALNAASYS
jgi:hypothetical protein